MVTGTQDKSSWIELACLFALLYICINLAGSWAGYVRFQYLQPQLVLSSARLLMPWVISVRMTAIVLCVIGLCINLRYPACNKLCPIVTALLPLSSIVVDKWLYLSGLSSFNFTRIGYQNPRLGLLLMLINIVCLLKFCFHKGKKESSWIVYLFVITGILIVAANIVIPALLYAKTGCSL